MTLSTSGSLLRRGASALAVAAVLGLTASSAAAQTSYFVDPVSGTPGATGLAGDPVDTIGEALSLAASGDTVFLADGTYGNITGTGKETFPLVLVDGVSVRADTGATPVIDVENTSDNAFGVPSLTAPVLLEGLTVNQGSQGLFNLSGSSVNGLAVQDCTFNGFTGAGINLFLDAGEPALSLVIDGCTVAGNSAPRGISLRVGGSTTVSAGGINGCTVSGAAEGIVVVARGTSTVSSAFAISDNDVSGASDAGIKMRAWGDGGNAANLATISCVIRGNTVAGVVGANGIELLAEVGTSGEGGQIYSAVEFNLITGAGFGIALEAINNGSALTEIGATFYGNRISGNNVGVAAAENSPNGANQNVFPNFGDANHGANTFASSGAVDILVDNNVGSFPADFNFFPAGAPTTNPAWTGNIQNVLSETLTGTFAGSAPSNLATTQTLTAGALVRFVDNDSDGAEQISATVDGNAVAAADLSAPRPGGALDLLVPSLVAGTYDVVVTNPGGQTGTVQIDVADPPPVVAEFSGTPTGGPMPLTVDFTDLSTGNPTTWSWDFGDGNTSTDQNPTNVYATPGVYTVSLTAIGAGGSDTMTKTNYISVSAMAAFSATPTEGLAPLEVTFTDESSGTPTAWAWDFGDGNTSTEQNPVHTYTTGPGLFTVSLTVTDAQGSDTVVRTDYIVVNTRGGGGGGGCFVATAAHGDYDSPEVYELRRLRDQYLQTTGAGRAFISWYYEDGPVAADWIAERDWARSGARMMLAAPVALSQALNDWNPGQRFGFAVLLLGAVFALGRRRVG